MASTLWEALFGNHLSSTSTITACRASSYAAISCKRACLGRNCSPADKIRYHLACLLTGHCRSRDSHTKGDFIPERAGSNIRYPTLYENSSRNKLSGVGLLCKGCMRVG